jgi:hypothetical protein
MISTLPRATTPLQRRSVSVVVALATAAVVLGAAIVYQPVLAAVLVPGIALLLLVVGVTRALTPSSDAGTLSWVMTWTLAAFAIHLAAGLVIVGSSDLTRYFGGDAVTYSTGAAGILQHWTHGAALPTNLPTGKTGFFYMLAALYLGFGVHPQAGIVVNAAMVALVIPLLTDATRRHLGSAAARPVPVLVTLMPGFLIWGSQLLREAGVYLLIAVALNCAIRMMSRTSVSAMVVMVVAVGLLFTFRADVGLLVGAGLAIAVTLGRRQLAGGLAGGVGTLALVLALVVGGGLGYSGYRFVTHTNLAQVNIVRTDSSHSAASGFLQASDVSTPQHAASYIPLGATYFVLGPAPWQVRSLRQILAVPDALVWWFLLPSLWRGIREGRRRRGREILIYLLPALALTVVLTLLIANFGTAVRERMQVIIFLIPLIGLGWSVRHPARQAAAVSVTAEH